MNDIRASIERRIDAEMDAVLAGRRGFLTGREIIQFCLDEAFREHVSSKIVEQILAEHPEFAG